MDYIRNELLKMSIDIPAGAEESVPDILQRHFKALKRVYLYKVIVNIKDDVRTGWTVEYFLSAVDRYNTLSVQEAISEIDSIIKNDAITTKKLIGFKQPPIELILTMYEPLVNKLASEQAAHWPIEFDDLCQMCRLSILKLYKKGYYIHKSIIKTAFIRDVLCKMREEEREVEKVWFSWLNKEEREYVDNIEDESAQDAFEQFDQEAIDKEHKKDIVVAIIGQRTYDQMLREFDTGTVTGATRKALNKIKNQLLGGE